MATKNTIETPSEAYAFILPQWVQTQAAIKGKVAVMAAYY